MRVERVWEMLLVLTPQQRIMWTVHVHAATPVAVARLITHPH